MGTLIYKHAAAFSCPRCSPASAVIIILCTEPVCNNPGNSLDLSDLTGDQVEAVAAELYRLPMLSKVELMKADGTSNLSLTDVQILQKAVPNAVLHFEFEYQGLNLSTTTEEVHIKSKKIGDAGVEELRQYLKENTFRITDERLVLDAGRGGQNRR